MDKYVKSQLRDVEIIKQHLQGADISAAPLWFRSEDGASVLTYHGALNLVQVLGIERIKADVTQSVMNTDTFPKPCYHAVVYVKRGNLTRAGASSSQEREVSVELAFRNAVGQIIDQNHKPVANRKPQREIVKLPSGAKVEIRRIDHSPEGQRRWKQAQAESQMFADLVPDEDEIDHRLPQDDMEWAKEFAIEALLEGA